MMTHVKMSDGWMGVSLLQMLRRKIQRCADITHISPVPGRDLVFEIGKVHAYDLEAKASSDVTVFEEDDIRRF